MVYLDEDERARYEDMKNDFVLQLPGGEVTAANPAALSGKLTQMANGAVYSDAGGIEFIHDKKLDALEDNIEAANGKSLLVAYRFKYDLQRITERLDALGVNYRNYFEKMQKRLRKEGSFE